MSEDGADQVDAATDPFAVLDELEHRAEAVFDRERLPELADRSRAEYATVDLASRLMASLSRAVVLEVEGVGAVSGRLGRVGRDWCAVAGAGQDWLVRTAAVSVARGLSDRSVPEVAWPATARLGIGSALRRLADAGVSCTLRLRDGTAREAVVVRVGADFVEVRERSGSVLVAHAALAAVQTRAAED